MAKQLKQLLQEKQEPFVLELYLLEKGYLRNTFNSIDLKRTQKDIPKCSKLLRAVYNQLISLNDRLKIKTSNPRDVAETPDLGRLSSQETSTSQQRKMTIRVTEVVTDRKLPCQWLDESRQLSPVSVLEEVVSNRDSPSPAPNNGRRKLSSIKQKKVTEDSILSASLWKILYQSGRQKSTLPGGPAEIQELVHSEGNSKSEKDLQQTRQLLFDCVREIVETQENKRQQQQQQTQYLATQEFGKLIEEKIKCWGKQHGEESRLACLFELEFRNSAHEWIGYKPHARKIGRDTGDAILDEIMNEIVMDMLDFTAC
ncbi:uncharacterized protein [Euphorbia lathyris]|uniref:uncharacterized protein n=1 Tax=Euphorbia lathyris TaxID=212925 RepID=UPI0033142CB5